MCGSGWAMTDEIGGKDLITDLQFLLVPDLFNQATGFGLAFFGDMWVTPFGALHRATKTQLKALPVTDEQTQESQELGVSRSCTTEDPLVAREHERVPVVKHDSSSSLAVFRCSLIARDNISEVIALPRLSSEKY
jgi:hypothetical protein